VVLAALTLAPLPALAPSAAADPRPNFVLIVSDDQRWDTIGRCLNGFDGADLNAGADSCMPFLQSRLVAQGTTFTRGYVTTSLCCPSRASILTGQYARHTGVLNNLGFNNFRDGSSLATWLDGAGYRTALVGKYLNGYGEGATATPTNYVPPGWDAWHAFWGPPAYTSYSLVDKDPGGEASTVAINGSATAPTACAPSATYSTDLLCRRALNFLAADTQDPFFLFFTPFSPHEPPTAASRHAGLYDGVTTPEYPNYNAVPTPNTATWLPTSPLTTSTLNQLRSKFRRSLSMNRAVDDSIEQLSLQLQADGRLDNTVFIFMSDNGFAFGEHRFDAKGCAYEECHRVPFVVACPPTVCPQGVAGTIDGEHIALNIDLAPTIAELAGVTPGLRQDGRSLVPLLNGQQPAWRSSFLLEDQGIDKVVKAPYGILSTESDGHVYKLVRYLKKPSDGELFDLTNDPWELDNLFNQAAYSGLQAGLAARMNDMKTAPNVTLTGPSGDLPNTSATFTWTASQQAEVDCRLDSAPFTSCGSGTSGSILVTELSLGAHTFDLRGYDVDNNVSLTLTKGFTVVSSDDTTPPAPPTFTQTPPNPSGTSVTFAFTSEAGATLSCSMDGATFATCTSPTTYMNLTDGSHTFSVLATDAAGNAGAPAAYTWDVSSSILQPPTLTQTPSNPTSSGTATFSFTGAPNTIGFRCSLDASAFTDCTSPKTYSGLVKATHTFSVRAVGDGGIESADTTYTWVIKRL
jgi:N-acetylglucosamine-6-sulfatase